MRSLALELGQHSIRVNSSDEARCITGVALAVDAGNLLL
jgi:hypothetical protein